MKEGEISLTSKFSPPRVLVASGGNESGASFRGQREVLEVAMTEALTAAVSKWKQSLERCTSKIAEVQRSKEWQGNTMRYIIGDSKSVVIAIESRPWNVWKWFVGITKIDLQESIINRTKQTLP